MNLSPYYCSIVRIDCQVVVAVVHIDHNGVEVVVVVVVYTDHHVVVIFFELNWTEKGSLLLSSS